MDMNKFTLTDEEERKFAKILENREMLKNMLNDLAGVEYVKRVREIIENNKGNKALLRALAGNVDDAFMEERIEFSDRYDLVCDRLYPLI